MYNEIYNLIGNDLKNYDQRTITQKTISRQGLECIHSYVEMLADDECRKELALIIALPLDEKLYNHIQNVTDWDVGVTIPESFIDVLRQLQSIDEALKYEETENLGFSWSAHDLRKQWRRKLREAHRLLNMYHKNHLNWVKEHNKPHPTYELKATGECHNGLYWTLRELVLHPSYIKYGFRRISK